MAASSETNVPTWAKAMGERLREIRTERGESLASVARVTRLSSSFLSMLEQGRTDISLGRLLPVLEHYGLRIEEVLGSGDDAEVMRGGDPATTFSAGTGVEAYVAVRHPRRSFTPFVVSYEPGAWSTWSEHRGWEFVFALEGAVRVERSDLAAIELAPGDSVHFEASRPHRVGAGDAGPARVLVVLAEDQAAWH
ncbi:cupin domain-containing protein [Nocardioides lijunqiniae]|uniref:cupin domain-containing protein n=1 Tax=Nocardioides lijunqiniae TaxID=2760832 RepID=UPI001878FE1D